MAVTYLVLILLSFTFASTMPDRWKFFLKGRLLPEWCIFPSVLVIVLSFISALVVDYVVAIYVPGGIPEARTGPFVYVDFVRVNTGWKVGTLEGVFALFQTIASVIFFCALSDRGSIGRYRFFLTTGVCILGGVSIFAPYLGSSDVYAYIAQSVSQPSGYSPGLESHSERFWPVFVIWGNPTLPSPYGPLWLWIVKMIVGVGGGVWGSVIGLRVLGTLSLLACVWSLGRLGIDARVRWMFLLSPELWRLYVLDVHNDLVPTAFLFVATSIATRLPMIALLLVAAATAVKIPFALFGLSVFRASPTIKSRFLLPLIGGSFGVLASVVVAGDAYPDALVQSAAAYRHTTDSFEIFLHVAAVLMAVYGSIAFVLDRKMRSGAIVCVISLSQFVAEQYLAWSMPFLSASSFVLGVYLCLMPTAGFLLSFTYAVTPFTVFLRSMILVLLTGVCASRLFLHARRRDLV